jgi:ABC-type transport system involved in multi-copper enzyme maturation permease subunit
MEIALITEPSRPYEHFVPGFLSILWKTWCESRARFFSALLLLLSLVGYAVLTSPGFLNRYNAHFPDKPLLYSVYVWTGLFHYALECLWVLAALVVTLGGLAREKANGVALFSLGLPVSRRRLFLIRSAVALAQSLVLGLASALLIPLLSLLVGEAYPFSQTLVFGSWMSVTGFVIVAFGLLLSEIFEAEFTAPVVGLCFVTAFFFGYRSHTLRGWNVFDVMSATSSIDPRTQLLTGTFHWLDLAICLLCAFALVFTTDVVIKTRDF